MLLITHSATSKFFVKTYGVCSVLHIKIVIATHDSLIHVESVYTSTMSCCSCENGRKWSSPKLSSVQNPVQISVHSPVHSPVQCPVESPAFTMTPMFHVHVVHRDANDRNQPLNPETSAYGMRMRDY